MLQQVKFDTILAFIKGNKGTLILSKSYVFLYVLT